MLLSVTGDGLMDVLLFTVSNGFTPPPPPLFPAGSALRVFQLWTGGGSRGQLFQLPELRRVRALQRPLLRLDRVGVSGREDGATRQVSDQIRTVFQERHS